MAQVRRQSNAIAATYYCILKMTGLRGSPDILDSKGAVKAKFLI
jgi:hypothetical protein